MHFTSNASSSSAIITATGKVACSSSISGYMQDFKPCSSLSGSGSLTDRRDNQVYTVAKINGNWWMTRNLAIGCNGSGSSYGSSVSSKQLTSTDSNISATWSTPTKLLSNDSGATGDSKYTVPRIECSSTYGAWYNYATATAETIVGTPNTTEATKDICPAGWRLPSGGANSEQSGITGYKSLFNPVVGGYWYNGTLFRPEIGYFWSKTSRNNDYRYYLQYDGSNLVSTGSDNRGGGSYIRCILK